MGSSAVSPPRRRGLELAKELVVSGRDPSPDAVRDRILSSWRRSKLWGVPPDALDPPYAPDLDDDSLLTRAALPVIDRLDEALSGTAMSVLLTDARGRILERRASDPSLVRHLDRIHLAPGFSYSEEHVGTNGIGSAIESRAPFFVAGPEHFARPLAGVSCAGAPIVHPVTGRLEGVIDLTCRAADATPLMTLLATEAASDVVDGILDHVSSAERALLRAFLTASRQASRPVVAISGDLVMTNAAAAALLDRNDHAVLSDRATDLARSGRTHCEVLLSNGEATGVHVRSVAGSDGVVLELGPAHETGRRRETLRHTSARRSELAGTSATWLATWSQVDSSCRTGERLLVTGERGTGKAALVAAAHRSWRPGQPLTVVDLDTSTAEEAIERLDPRALPSGSVVLRHLDALDTDASEQVLREALSLPRSAVWLAATWRQSADTVEPLTDTVSRHFDRVVTAPPLRHHIEDVRELVEVLLGRLSRNPHTTLDAGALSSLLRHPWPGNVAELEQALIAALRRHPAGPIHSEDLPPSVHCTSRKVLTGLEAVERDMIAAALLDAGGDKARAAERLGISRATIYRKIRAYGIVLPHAQAASGSG